MHHLSIDDLRPLLRSTDALLNAGWKERKIRRALVSGALHKVRQGVYIDGQVWSQLWPESRHRAEVIAAADHAGDAFVASHDSAAVLFDWPLYRLTPTHVHVTVDSRIRISSGARVARHSAKLDETDVTVRHGISCTTPSRTTFDVVRTLTPEAAIACADASLGAAAVTARVQDEQRAGEWREDLLRRTSDCAHQRGVRQARRMRDLADGRAELPGESVSRLQLIRLGFARPRTQVPVAAPGSGFYWVDLGLDDVRAFGEFDGKDKYLNEAKRRGRTVQDVMMSEKQREDWIRGTTQWRMGRWGDEHITTAETLGRRLASFGIVPPSR